MKTRRDRRTRNYMGGIKVVPPGSDESAVTLRSGTVVVVGDGNMVGGGVHTTAGQIVINGVVNGDVICIGDSITINGEINGSLTVVTGKAGKPDMNLTGGQHGQG